MTLRRVSVIVIEPVAMFEVGVAIELFGVDRRDEGLPYFDFRVCSATPGRPVATKDGGGFAIVPTYGLDDVAGSDLVVVAPTAPVADDRYPPGVLETLRRAHAEGAILLSLCSGSFVLGAAGLLDGRTCTTHWIYADQMQQRYPKARVDPRGLYVDEDKIITSAGTSAGIDAGLYLIRRELGSAVANKIARRMVVPPQRDGGQQQFVATPIPECRADSLAALLAWALDRLGEQHSAASLAQQALMSERTFARRFRSETGTTPHKWLTQQRVLAARTLLEESDLGIEQIAERVGFNSAVVLRDHFRREVGVPPQVYRARFGSAA